MALFAIFQKIGINPKNNIFLHLNLLYYFYKSKMFKIITYTKAIIFISSQKKHYRWCCLFLILESQPIEYTLIYNDGLQFTENNTFQPNLSSFFQHQLIDLSRPFWFHGENFATD